MRLTYDVKARAFGMGADLVGIAPVDRFEHAPEDGKPQYYMPDAKCVVVIATRILKGLCDVHGSYEEKGKTIAPYFWHGYSQVNWGNSWMAIQVGRLLEDSGYTALPFPATGCDYRNVDKVPQDLPDFYYKHAAVAAGLGEFVLSRLLLTPEFGARQRVIPIVTNAPLDPDPMYNGPKLCRREECNDLCIKACPMKAYEGKLKSVKIGDRVFEYAVLNSRRCRWHSVAGKYLRGGKDIPRFPTDEYLEKTLIAADTANVYANQNPYDRGLYMFTWGAACGDCMIRCPAPFE
jgi:epoxyqueuosine reductase